MRFVNIESYGKASFIFIFKSLSFLIFKLIFFLVSHCVVLSSGNNTMKGLVSISDFNLINFFKQFGFGNEYIQ